MPKPVENLIGIGLDLFTSLFRGIVSLETWITSDSVMKGFFGYQYTTSSKLFDIFLTTQAGILSNYLLPPIDFGRRAANLFQIYQSYIDAEIMRWVMIMTGLLMVYLHYSILIVSCRVSHGGREAMAIIDNHVSQTHSLMSLKKPQLTTQDSGSRYRELLSHISG